MEFGVDIDALPSLDALQKGAESVKNICGVYFLFHRERLVYVGQSKNVLSRIAQHLNDKQFDAWSYIEVPPATLKLVEELYLTAFKPPLNKFYGLNKFRSPYTAAAKRLRDKTQREPAGDDLKPGDIGQ